MRRTWRLCRSGCTVVRSERQPRASMASRSWSESRAIGRIDDGCRRCAGVRCAVVAGATSFTGVITHGGRTRRDHPARAQARRSRRERGVAGLGSGRLRRAAARAAAMIRIDALWLCTQPLGMRSGAERLMAHVVHALGSARAHHGYLFANMRATRISCSCTTASACGVPPGGSTPGASCGRARAAPRPHCR